MDIASWTAYHWNLFKEFGRECYRTYKGEMLASLLVIGFIFLVNHAAIDLRTGLLASGYTLGTYSLWHLLRTPWLLQKRLGSSEGDLHPGWGIVGMIFGLGSVVLWLYTAAWFYTIQPPVTIPIRLPDSRDAQIIELQQKVLELEHKPEKIVTVQAPSEPLHIRTVTFGLEQKVNLNGKQGRAFVVVGLTNKPITPVDVTLVCNQEVQALGQPWIGTTQKVVVLTGVGFDKIDNTSFHLTVGSPAWTTDSPVGMPLFSEADDTMCSIKQN